MRTWTPSQTRSYSPGGGREAKEDLLALALASKPPLGSQLASGNLFALLNLPARLSFILFDQTSNLLGLRT